MNEQRIFRFAHAGVLVALLYTTASQNAEPYSTCLWISIAVALPATVFRGMISGHRDEERYNAASGFALYFSIPATIAAFTFLFASRSNVAAASFLVIVLLFSLLLRYGKKS